MYAVHFLTKKIDSKTHAHYMVPMYVAREVLDGERLILTYSLNPDRAMRFATECEAVDMILKHKQIGNIAIVSEDLPDFIAGSKDAIIKEIF